jgi:hypothetical protein
MLLAVLPMMAATSVNELLSSLPDGLISGEECRRRPNDSQEVHPPIAEHVGEEGQ